MRSFAFLALALAALFSDAARAGEPERPDLVLVVWNEPAREALGFLGTGGETPNLDALVKSGAWFPAGTQTLARGRTTAAALLTGRMPQESGIYFQTGPKKLAPENTLAVLLHQAGYATLIAGKLREGQPAAFGFDAALDDVRTAGASGVEGFLAQHAGKQPLFLWWAPEVAESFGTRALDRVLGELVAALEAHGRRASTLFAFVTNGEPLAREFTARECSEKRLANPLALVWPAKIAAGARPEVVTPLDLFPTLLEYAGVAAPQDLPGLGLRALLESAPGSASPADLAARALCGAFFANQPSQGSKVGRFHEKDLEALTVRAGQWKYELFLDDVGVKIDPATELVEIECSAGDQRLFDLAADPGEDDDLFSLPQHAERLAQLRQSALDAWHASGGHDFPVPYLPPALGPAPKEAHPNVVLIVSDDQDYEHLGFMGNPRVHTPTLDALAAQGLVFPVAHVPMSRCRPSLAALLSGRFPQSSGVYENEAPHTLARRDSLPNLLKAAGYATFAGGKFWEGSEHSMGFIEPRRADAVFKNFVRENQDDLFAFVDRYAGERPMFVWWAPMLPHGPYNPPERLRALFAHTDVPVPEWIAADDKTKFQEAERTSFAMEAWLDEGLAAFRAKLAAKNQLDNTLFVFLIDNGFANGCPSKGTVFEKGLRTPVVFSWPKMIPAGRTSDSLVNSVDLYATILDYAGLALPQEAQGISLRPTLEGKEQKTHDVLYGAVYRYKERPGPRHLEKDVYALYARTPRWKFVLYLRDLDPDSYVLYHEFCPFPERKRGDRDLFDLAQDPYERNDLAADSSHAALMDELLQGCLSWWRATGGGELDLP